VYVPASLSGGCVSMNVPPQVLTSVALTPFRSGGFLIVVVEEKQL
jgi:hypothetical protein